MYTEMVIRASKAKYIYGMTATPTRADGMILGVHANCGPVVFRRDTQWGVQNGFLSNSKFYMIYLPQKRRYYDSMNESKAYACIVDNNDILVRELAKIVSHMLKHGRKILFLTKNVKPSQRLAERLSALFGVTLEVAHGGYRKPLNDFRQGKVNLLIANDALCGEGVDIPGVDCMINLTQRSSESSIRQILGRGLRISEGKDCLYFFDFVLSGYGSEYKSFSGEKKWKDRYLNASRMRKRVYTEINEVIETHVR
jgi:superfamily II DNA or RNA helicase